MTVGFVMNTDLKLDKLVKLLLLHKQVLCIQSHKKYYGAKMYLMTL